MDELHEDRTRQRLRINRSQRIFRLFGWLLGGAILCAPYGLAQMTRTRSGQPTTPKPGGMPGLRTTTDARNCYPYDGRWNDRIDRALATGLPVAIEQDLNWYVPSGGRSPRIVVGHGGPLTGGEPELEHYFFDRIRPVVEAALKNPDHSQWPVITLNLDFKTEEPEHLRAVRALLERYQAWLSSAPRTADDRVQPMDVGPVLVLNGPSEIQQKVFYDEVPIGGQLLTFGAARTDMRQVTAAPSIIEASLPPTIAAGGTIRGAWLKRKVSRGRAPGRLHRKSACTIWLSMPTSKGFGFGFIRWTAQPRNNKSRTVGFTSTTFQVMRRRRNAGARPLRAAWTTWPPISMRMSADSCAVCGLTRSTGADHDSDVLLDGAGKG